MTFTRKSIADYLDSYDDEIAALQDSKRDTLNEYRQQLADKGFGKAAIKAEIDGLKVAMRRRRAVAKKGAEEIEQADAIADEIFLEITSPARRATRVATSVPTSYAEEKGRSDDRDEEITSVSVAPQGVEGDDEAVSGKEEITSFDPETGEITDNQMQPVPSSPPVDANAAQDDVGATASSTHSEHTISPAPERKAAGSAPREMGGEGANLGGDDVDGSASARPSGQEFIGAAPRGVDRGIEIVERNTSGPDAKRATNSDLRPVSQAAASPASDAAPSEAGATTAAASRSSSDDDFDPSKLSFLNRPAVKLRPHCQHPELCRSGTREHCHSCKVAMAERESVEA